MSTAENKRIVESFYDAGNRGDMDTTMGLLADDVVWTNIGTTKYSGTFTGKGALVENILGPVFGQLKRGIAATVDNVVAEGDFVVVQLRGTAETTSGRPYNNTYCHVFRLCNGKICEVTEYFDTQLVSAVLS
jgi:uncharacterized protein